MGLKMKNSLFCWMLFFCALSTPVFAAADCKVVLTGCSISGTQEVDNSIAFTVFAQNVCTETLYYRWSFHPDYGTDGYDNTQWTSMTDTEYVTDSTISYTFPTVGKYIVVVWVVSEPVTDPSEQIGVPTIGWSVDITEAEDNAWVLYDDFNDNAIDGDKWLTALGNSPEEISGRLFFQGGANIFLGTVEGARGVEAELELSSDSGIIKSEMQVGLSVLNDSHDDAIYSIYFELSSYGSQDQIEIELNIEDPNVDVDHEVCVVTTAQFDQKYKLGVILDGDKIDFYVDDVKVYTAEFDDLDIDSNSELYPFVGTWVDQDYNQIAKGYVDNVKIITQSTQE